MNIVLLRTGTLALAAALCAALPAAPDAAAQEGCTAQAAQTWAAAGQPAFTLEAFASGPTCADAVATLVIRTEDGAALYAEAFVAAWNFMLREATTPAQMEDALQRWIDPAEFNVGSTGALPEWAPDTDRPAGEFPFYPSEIYAYRDSYEELRAANLPLYCVVAGSESGLCVVYLDGRIDEVGRQSFPG